MANKVKSLDELQKLKSESLIKMTELALLTDLRRSTLKHWVEIGIIPFEQEGENLLRMFKKGQSIKRIKEILHLQNKKRLTITEIQEHFNNK